MATIKTFEDIQSWQKARALNELIGQIERSSGLIMDNIAEGFERSGNREFLQFYISKGSCGEFRSQLYRALDRGYIEMKEFEELFALSKEIIVLLQSSLNIYNNQI